MNCEEIQAQLSDYLEHSLSDLSLTLVEDHLMACMPCREEAELLGESIRQVAALPLAEPPVGFTQRVMAHVLEAEHHRGFWQWLFLDVRAKIPIQATALAMVAILGVYLLLREPSYKQSDTPTKNLTTESWKDQQSAPGAPPSSPQSQSIPQTDHNLAATAAAPSLARREPDAPLSSSASAGARSASSSGRQQRTGGAQPAPKPREKATSTISGTPVVNRTQIGGNPVTFSFPLEPDTASALRPAPAAIEPFADYELVVRRYGAGLFFRREESGGERQNRETAERGSTPRAIDQLMAAIPDYTRPQTIWIIVSKNQYDQFKKELQNLGTIESETQVPLLREQVDSESQGQIRVKLTAVPAADHSAPNYSTDR